MDPQHRDKIREAARRQLHCPKCGADVERIAGLDDDSHLPEITYLRCRGCGYERIAGTRRSRTETL